MAAPLGSMSNFSSLSWTNLSKNRNHFHLSKGKEGLIGYLCAGLFITELLSDNLLFSK